MSGIMVLHEMLHETKKQKEAGIILKLDFEKAYDKVSWKFLFDCLKARDFNEVWCKWIQEVVYLVVERVSIKTNNRLGNT